MTPRALRVSVAVATGATAALMAGSPDGDTRFDGLSRRAADSFARKVLTIRQFAAVALPGARLTPIYQTELNSYFRYNGASHLPVGVTDPSVAILGDGLLSGRAIVDLDAVRRTSEPLRWLDSAASLSGRLEVAVTGWLESEGGRARFRLQVADLAGVPVPKGVLQELVAHFSRSPEFPSGVRLDEPIELPARIQEIHVREGQAVIVQR